jgi:hypothetical protein
VVALIVSLHIFGANNNPVSVKSSVTDPDA